ncbi:MAG TPA: hypothetical protein VHW09_16755 [Bryobacteraceae bacterium]|jgi:hypothetical protein|nr:hypothetical protein [Bryobacteraceae bacterium]
MLHFFTKVSALLFATSVFLPAQQTVWFTPLPAALHPDGYFGSTDYLTLFSPTAPWQQAAAHVQVFKIYGVDDFSDTELTTLLTNLKQRNIALALEWPVLTSSTCGLGIEGFGGGLLGEVQRIQGLGGTLRYLAMLQPFQWGSLYQGAGACQWTVQQVAANALLQVNQAKSVFPNLLVGDIMAVPPFQASTSSWAAEYGSWFDTWRTLTGTPMAFFHVDVDWTTPNWEAAVAAIRPLVEQRGIPFGIVYNGFLTNESDAAWMAAAESHFVNYETTNGYAPPEQVNFQSWNPNPTHVLPETDPTAFTYLIDRYFRSRTALSLANDGTVLSGKLSSGTNAIAGANVQLTSQPLSGPGTVGTYTITGTVPTEATTALVGLRVNSECYSCNGAADLTVYSFQYGDTQTGATWGYSTGLSQWVSPGVATTTSGPAPYGLGVTVTAQPGQTVGLNSTRISVTPGVAFTLQVTARVAPVSIGSGYFTLIWFSADGNEPSRETILFEPQAQTLTTATTALDGTFSAGIAVDSGTDRVTAQYAGSGSLWPAMATVPATPTPGAPSIVSLTPSTPSGASTAFTAIFSDPAGWAAIANAEVLINTNASSAGGCNISYLPATGTFQLLDDSGTVWSSTVLANSQCTVSGTSALGTGNNLTLNFTVTLNPSFGLSGTQKAIFLQATDSQGAVLPWAPSGTWSMVPSGCSQAGAATVADVQSFISQALGASAAASDLNGDGVVNIVEVQLAIGDLLGCQAISGVAPAGSGTRAMEHRVSWTGRR